MLWYQELLDTCLRRFILPAKISDHTGSSFVTVFDDDAKKIFGGVSADEMWEMQHANEDGYRPAPRRSCARSGTDRADTRVG